MSCDLCQSVPALRDSMVRLGIVATTDYECPDEFAICDDCPQHILRDGADACLLIEDGKPCALNVRIRDNGPWPLGCRRTSAANHTPHKCCGE